MFRAPCHSIYNLFRGPPRNLHLPLISPPFGAYGSHTTIPKESVDLTGLSDANAYNWNGFTAGLQVPMSSSEGGGGGGEM